MYNLCFKANLFHYAEPWKNGLHYYISETGATSVYVQQPSVLGQVEHSNSFYRDLECCCPLPLQNQN